MISNKDRAAVQCFYSFSNSKLGLNHLKYGDFIIFPSLFFSCMQMPVGKTPCLILKLTTDTRN